MKRLLTVMAALAFSISLFAQAQITTKKEKLSDFYMKTTKVGLTGDDYLDAALKDAFKNVWTLTAYEFSAPEEWPSLLQRSEYYLVVPVRNKFRRNNLPGLMMLSLVKGGSGKTLDEMLEVTTIPLCAADGASGREAAYLPALVSLLQQRAAKALEGSFSKVNKIGTQSLSSLPPEDKIFLCEEDLSPQIEVQDRLPLREYNIFITDADTADEFFTQGVDGILTSYCIMPARPEKGAFCYKMIFDARTNSLYYFSRHKITKGTGGGFLRSDLRWITSHRGPVQ